MDPREVQKYNKGLDNVRDYSDPSKINIGLAYSNLVLQRTAPFRGNPQVDGIESKALGVVMTLVKRRKFLKQKSEE